jgi:acyl-CoA reductase-like NAD-dependent aldehyde dehydrogenase
MPNTHAAPMADPQLAGWDPWNFPAVKAATAEHVHAAVTTAHDAFAEWASTPASRRRDVILEAADLLESRIDDYAGYLSKETGGTATWAAVNVMVTANNMRIAAGTAQLPPGELVSSDRPGEWSMAVRQPAGVVAAVTPWNAPLLLCARGIMVPLATGNAVVLRPSEDAPVSSGLFLAETLRDAGLPEGVLNVVLNDRADAPQVIEALIADPLVRRVNFTGSTQVGRIVAEIAGRHLKPTLLELGGKNPAIVCDDADIAQAASAITYARYMNSGQICLSLDRIILHESIAARFTDEFVARVAALRAGEPDAAGTVVGPLVNQRAADRVGELIEDAVAHGATVLAGGGKPDGRLVQPTVLTGVTPQMRIYHEETFGPVACLFTVPDDAAAIELANDTEYGLTSAVFTGDGARGLAIARRLEHGCTHINSHTIKEDPEAPIGGVKDSGYGSFGGHYGVEFFTQVRWLTLAEQPDPLPSWAVGPER